MSDMEQMCVTPGCKRSADPSGMPWCCITCGDPIGHRNLHTNLCEGAPASSGPVRSWAGKNFGVLMLAFCTVVYVAFIIYLDARHG